MSILIKNPKNPFSVELITSSSRPGLVGYHTLTDNWLSYVYRYLWKSRSTDFRHGELLLIDFEQPLNYKKKNQLMKNGEKPNFMKFNGITLWSLLIYSGDKLVGLDWVFKDKTDALGTITKYTTSLVARGSLQKQGIDFEKVFASLARIYIIHLFLALMV